jgi:hypothetical protein
MINGDIFDAEFIRVEQVQISNAVLRVGWRQSNSSICCAGFGNCIGDILWAETAFIVIVDPVMFDGDLESIAQCAGVGISMGSTIVGLDG